MRARTEHRETARRLRAEGRTYDEIQAAPGVSKSSISLWVRDVPVPNADGIRRDRMRRAAETRWGPVRSQRDEERRATKAAAAAEIGPLSDRDLFLVGIALYWAEGSKDKPYDRRESAAFINSDPDVVSVYLSWLRLLGFGEERWRLRVSIHESADVAAAELFWAGLAEVPVERLSRSTLKRHNPTTVRKNVGDNYRGCLVVSVLDSADLYRRIEGWWSRIVVETARRKP
ncbi:hypothetical protein OG689_17740 [Kitasatospora sp. NBC_00240]|uniref:hypothetical protein n=1 Tax=Kitasatospora sp. NBC_00240 TaxID=2903567 RepID=UPI00224F9571|nr:hypothetical protein [Kitasatospora sp. NBC_00240]MCX5211110.1 hypothetical protein [Kitasatospora sp. NBC_00240]